MTGNELDDRCPAPQPCACLTYCAYIKAVQLANGYPPEMQILKEPAK